MKLALIGVGRWGTNIKRTLEGMGVEVVGIDKTPSQSPPVRGEVDGVLIATPASTHAKIALPFIRAGVPVFIEKPMTTSLQDAQKIAQTAKKSGTLVMIGHVHLYNPAYLKAKELVKKAGKIKYLAFEGMNWGPFRDDVSAMWDWAPHDIALAMDLLGSKPKTVQAWGTRDWAEMKLEFPEPHPGPPLSGRESIPALIHVTWLSPEKRKKMTVVGEKYSVVFDDVAEYKVAVHQDGKITYPSYKKEMPLQAEMKAFLQMVKTGKRPKTDVQQGLDVVRVLDAAERSLALDGKAVRC